MLKSLLTPLAAVALVVGGAVVVPTSAEAATPTARQGLTALAASAEYLVYGRGSAATKDEAVTGALYYRAQHGPAHRLAASKDLRTARADIAGSMVVYQPDASTPDASTLSWRDLATGRTGTFPQTQTIALSDGSALTAEYKAPAAGGRVLEAATRGADHLYLQTTTGAVRDLGAPEPGGDSLDNEGRPDLNDHLKVRTSRTALVVTASDEESYSNGSASVMTFAKPGKYTRLVGLGHSPSCLSVTTRFIACSVTDTPSARKRLYSTDGRLLIKTRKAGEAYVAGSALAGQVPTSRKGEPRISLTSTAGKTRTVQADLRTRGQSGLSGLIVSRGHSTWGATELAVLTSTGKLHPLTRTTS